MRVCYPWSRTEVDYSKNPFGVEEEAMQLNDPSWKVVDPHRVNERRGLTWSTMYFSEKELEMLPNFQKVFRVTDPEYREFIRSRLKGNDEAGVT